jgi:hypothetical protein
MGDSVGKFDKPSRKRKQEIPKRNFSREEQREILHAIMKSRTSKLFETFSVFCITPEDTTPSVLNVVDIGFSDPKSAEKRFAVLSGHHIRLGASSPLMILPREILVKICELAWPLNMREPQHITLRSPFMKPNTDFDTLCVRTLPSYPGLRKLLNKKLELLNIKPPLAIKKSGTDNIGLCFKDCMQTNERRNDTAYVSRVLMVMFLAIADITGQIFYPTVNIWHAYGLYHAVNICEYDEKYVMVDRVAKLLYELTKNDDASLAFECASLSTCRSDDSVWKAEIKLRDDFRTIASTHNMLINPVTEVCDSTVDEMESALTWLRKECPFEVATVAMTQYMNRHTQGRTLIPEFNIQLFMKRERYREFAHITGTTSYEQYHVLNWTPFGELHQMRYERISSVTRKKRSKCGEENHERRKKSKQV